MSNKVQTVYIAGPITGDPDYRDKFAAAADMLMQIGYAVVNPVQMCSDIRNAPRHEILAKCFRAAALVDILALLPEWQTSSGAKAELEVFQRTHSYDHTIFFVSSDYKSISNHVEADDYRLFSWLYGIDYQSSCEDDEDISRAIRLAEHKYKVKLKPRITFVR